METGGTFVYTWQWHFGLCTRRENFRVSKRLLASQELFCKELVKVIYEQLYFLVISELIRDI
jgi:hypothetical protein